MRIVALLGSLRKKSFNRALLAEAGKLLPPDHRFEILELDAIPLYNQDVQDAGIPAPVAALGLAVKSADAVLVGSPEYNYSIPGVLKNAIDWLSRLPEKPLSEKPIGIVSASLGLFGGVRMQLHLRQALLFTGGRVLTRPEFFLGTASTKFDENLTLTDPETKKHLKGFVEAFLKFAS